MTQALAPSPIPFTWSTADYGDDALYVTALRNNIPVGLITGETDYRAPKGHFLWRIRIFLPGVHVPEPLVAPREALSTVQARFKTAFDECCVTLGIRPVYPMLHPQWRNLGDQGHGLFSGDILVHRVYQTDDLWWHETYLNFGPEVAGPDYRLPRCFCLVNDKSPKHENTLEGAKDRASSWVLSWLMRSHFQMRVDPNSLPVGITG